MVSQSDKLSQDAVKALRMYGDKVNASYFLLFLLFSASQQPDLTFV